MVNLHLEEGLASAACATTTMETNTNGGGFVDRERYGGGRAAESHGRATLRWVAAQSRTGRRQKGRQQRSSQRHLLLECESEGFTVWVCRLLGLAGVGARAYDVTAVLTFSAAAARGALARGVCLDELSTKHSIRPDF